MKKTISFIIVIAAILSLGKLALATTSENLIGEITPMYINLISLSATIDIDNSGEVTCIGNMTQSLNNGSCELIINLQKQNSNKGWSTVATWAKEGITKCADVQYRDVSRGTYRLYVIGKVYGESGNLIETGTIYSISKTY